MRILLGGLAGTGTTTIARAIATTMGIPMLSAGGAFRALAEDQELSLQALEEEAAIDPRVDELIARQIRHFAIDRPAWVIEGRFARHSIGDVQSVFAVKCVCADLTRFSRIAIRDEMGFVAAKEATCAREALLARRFAERSGIHDWDADRHYNFVLDTTERTPESSFQEVLRAYAAHTGF